MVNSNNIEKILYMGVGRSGLENEASIIAKALSELMEYRNKAIQALEEIQQYRAIGTVEEFKELKEKTIAKKVISRNSIYRCPTCESLVSITQTKCAKCSQKLYWQ